MPYVEDFGGLDALGWKKGPGSVYDRVMRVAAEIFVPQGLRPEALTPELKILDLEADSLDTVELLMCLEVEFSVRIKFRDVKGFLTLGHVISFFEDR